MGVGALPFSALMYLCRCWIGITVPRLQERVVSSSFSKTWYMNQEYRACSLRVGMEVDGSSVQVGNQVNQAGEATIKLGHSQGLAGSPTRSRVREKVLKWHRLSALFLWAELKFRFPQRYKGSILNHR